VIIPGGFLPPPLIFGKKHFNNQIDGYNPLPYEPDDSPVIRGTIDLQMKAILMIDLAKSQTSQLIIS
jgi:hypothetical protein